MEELVVVNGTLSRKPAFSAKLAVRGTDITPSILRSLFDNVFIVNTQAVTQGCSLLGIHFVISSQMSIQKSQVGVIKCILWLPFPIPRSKKAKCHEVCR